MKGYFSHLEEEVKKNSNFRKVLYTGHHSQLVLMSLLPGEEIGMEVHPDNDQFFRFDQGEGKMIVDGNEYEVKDGDAVLVPAGAAHNVINTGSEPLRFYTIYSPPHHKDGIVRKTKKEAEEQMAEFDGETTE
jgi:Mannose-6-phosphate isomerase